MYTVLIVDDEDLAREDISYKVGASGFPFSWIMEASSAEEALEILQYNRPDILLTDIKMGAKSGLDLLEEAKALYPDLVTVIICGYPDFNYAQQAVKLGVTNYLLKPVKKDEVTEVLASATQAVRSIRARQNAFAANYKLAKTIKSHRLQESVAAFASSGGRDGESPLRSYFNPETSRWYQMAMMYIPLADLLQWKNKQSGNLMLYGIQNMAQELSQNETLIASSTENINILFMILGTPLPQKAAAKNAHHAFITKLMKKVEEVYGISITVSLSELYSTLQPSICAEASIALDLRFSCSNACGAVYQYKDLPQASQDLQEDKIPVLKRLLRGGETRKGEHLAKEMLLSFRDTPVPGIRNLYRSIINAISIASFRQGVSILPLLGSENLNGSILNSFQCLADITENISHIIETSLGGTGPVEDSQEILLRIRQYIDNSFTDSSLSTNKLSKEFCISLGYLSASYKKEHGITISKYIIQKRLNYAQKLLRETDFSVGEISELCGFNNISYFMRLFKSRHHITPTQYRQNEVPSPEQTTSQAG